MSGNNYNYGYYPASSGSTNYSNEPQSLWRSEWSIEQQQYNNSTHTRNPAHSHSLSSSPHSNASTPPIRNHYYNNYRTSTSPQANGRPYHIPRRQYNTQGQQQYAQTGQQQNWNRNANNYKRQRLDSDELEPKTKTSKKKKKPLSQNVPSKKDWTMEDAEQALSCEKEYNKRHKNQSLIIKFPDLELNKEIVSKFHGSIENVHFQQPSTARFCFVTLDESADSDSVIAALNQHKFGDGYLTAEYKKDREEDQNIGPEDIDPHTLYVGNLAQEITKEDMVKTYPKCKRIDIGYAKKMKYTRYAFVTFKSVTDSVEAFKKTHSTQMYSKSLIVRFRRLHGTVGMPGESKPQNPPKSTSADDTIVSTDITSNGPEHVEDNTAEEHDETEHDLQQSIQSPPVVKEEEIPEFRTPFLPGSVDKLFALHRPKIVKVEVKQETDVDDNTVTLEPDIGVANKSQNQVQLDIQSEMKKLLAFEGNHHLTIQLSLDSEAAKKLPTEPIEIIDDRQANSLPKRISVEIRLPTTADKDVPGTIELDDTLIREPQVDVMKIKEEINDNGEPVVKSEPQEEEDDDEPSNSFGSIYQSMLSHANNLSRLDKSRP